MVARTKLAFLIGMALVGSTGAVAATGGFGNHSIWSGDNPGQGAEHAAMPPAGQENNHGGNDHEGNGAGHDHGDNETGDDHGDDHGDNETGDDHDDNETGDDHDDNETGDDHGDNETGDDHGDNETGDDDFAAGTMYAFAPQYQSFSNTSGDSNWSRNWTHGNVSCSGSGNRTSGSVTCDWPAGNFTHGNLTCSWDAGSFTVKWSRGHLEKSWNGGNFTCAWTGGSWSHDEGGSESTDTTSADAPRPAA